MVRPLQHDLLNQEELSSYNERGYFLYRKQLFDGVDLAALDGISGNTGRWRVRKEVTSSIRPISKTAVCSTTAGSDGA